MATASSSLRLLHLPLLQGDKQQYHENKENEDTIRGWDQTLVGDSATDCTICSHAVAQGSVVHGTTTTKRATLMRTTTTTTTSTKTSATDDNDSNTINNEHINEWISWHTTLDHTVGHVCSNRDGSIVVASTHAGTVSLLSGTDGSLLATRMVSKSLGTAAEIRFVAKNTSNKDILMIRVPDTTESGSTTQLILVSNIDGPALNDTETCLEATRSMAIEAVSVPLSNIALLETTETAPGRLRFVAVTTGGALRLFDYYHASKFTASNETASKKKQLVSVAVPPCDFTIQVSAGMTIQHHTPSSNAYLVMTTTTAPSTAASSKKSCTLVWYSLSQLSIACRYQVTTKATSILALEPVTSCSIESAMALAVATKECIHILQVVVEETMGLAILKDAHVVYKVPMSSGQLASLSSKDESLYYAFRFANDDVCREFTASSPLVGSIRLLLQQERFDQADATISQNEHGHDSDGYSHFHPTEVSLVRLQHILMQPSITAETMRVAQECLQRLAQLDGSSVAVENFLKAADAIYHWQSPQLSAYMMALTAMSQCLQVTIQSSTPSNERIVAKRVQLEECRVAMHALSKLLVLLPNNQDDAKLDGNFLKVRSMSDLLRVLLSEGLFEAAAILHRSDQRKGLTPQVVVSTIISLSPTKAVDPRGYVSLLVAGIVGLDSVKHSLLTTVSAWACRTADALVSSSDGNLESSIFLLQHVHNAMNQLHNRTYASYASFSPFVEVLTRPNISPRNGTDASNSFRSNNSSSSTPQERLPIKTSSIDQPVPTILELGRLKGGAIKSSVAVRSAHIGSGDDDGSDDCDDVEVKLRHAKVLQQARQLGLTQPSSLRQFVRQGGATYLACELVRLVSRKAANHEARYEVLHSQIEPFCVESQVSFDEVLLSYGDEVCDSKHMTQNTLAEATSLARCCIKDCMKCQITLTVLRAALLCGAATPCLTALSKDAICWAGGDLSMRSELTEATRLLVINSIAVTYCGRDAALELFRVDNPSHAVKLLTHVCRHVTYPEALSDALKLCDAFTHLTKEDACIQILEMSILCGSIETCTILFNEVFDKEVTTAKSIWTRVLEFCAMTLSDTCTIIRSCKFRDVERSTAAQLCSKALAILEVTQQRMSARLLKTTEFASLLNSYQRVARLQRHHEIYVSPLELECRDVQLRIVQSVVASIRENFADGSTDSLSLFEKARRAACLLVGKEADAVSSVWFSAIEQEACQLVWSAEDGWCVQFLVQSGTLNKLSNHEAAQAVLSVVLNLCKRASQGAKDHTNIVSQMKLVLRASQLLHDYVLVSCPAQLLSVVSSLSNLTETIGRVLLMADNGVGDELENHRRQLRLWNCNVQENERTLKAPIHGTFKKPFLHSSWYVGDGLLLPLDETHGSCVEFCMDLVGLILCNQPPTLRGSEQLHSLLDERGAHSAALRVGCLTMAYTLSSSVFQPTENYQILFSFSTSYQNTLKCLAERSLGGSGNGITNPKVDSELALSYLHLLPIKLGFKVYKASLPTAITKRDFKRVRTLSNIGVVAGRGVQSSARSDFVPQSWKKQEKFVEQLEGLSMRARWWMTLQSFRVNFDPRRFEESTRTAHSTAEATNDARKDVRYAASLLEPLITNCCDQFQDAALPRSMAFSFCTAFGIEKQVAAQKHVEFLLSCPNIERQYLDDLRFDMTACEKAVRISLKHIPSSMKRAALLRKALIALEGNQDFDTDYERHGLLLSFYHEHLAMVVDDDSSRKKTDVKPFAEELESIDRRRDALSVLMSFFEGEQRTFRPNFPKFFSPLPLVFKLVAGGNKPSTMGVLGPVESPGNSSFDPLGPLQDFLVQQADASTATALAPLCVPLNLPQGYVHARTLVSRFQHSSASGSALPSLEENVLPVFNRLKSAKDQSILAEWCASVYLESDDQRMQCLDIALEHAMKASAEIEQRARRNPTNSLASEEQDALNRVRNISNDKSVLSDKNQVTQILETSKIGDADQFRAVKKMIDDLTARLNENLWKQADAAPDKFVELLLVEASLIASSACLTMDDAFTLDHLRYMAAVVHKACKEISEQYSHVHAGALCRKLARRWLVHGDSIVPSLDSESTKVKAKIPDSHSFAEEEDETINFVMDLNDFGDGDRTGIWSDDVGSSLQGQREDNLVTREEEPSALDMLGSAREVSEAECSKVALRIAFVMSFAEGYHPKAPESPNMDNENAGDGQNKRSSAREGTKKKRKGLLSRIPVGESNHDSAVMEHGRELLRVVFAKSGGAKERSDPSLSFLSGVGNDGGAKAATFVMRYRALRTAAVLCPQEALERIIKDEGFLRNSNGEVSCTLRQCTFGSFVAKEIEEMGLVLPHSDLVQLSTMQFSSYARALRRNHDTNSLRTKGRLLLLMVEMSTVSGQSWDQTFVVSVLSEMRKLRLPRSLLYACERYVHFIDSNQSNASDESNAEISTCALELIDSCLKESQKSLSDDRFTTLSRVAVVAEKLHAVQPDLVRNYAQKLLTLMSSSQAALQNDLAELATQCVGYIEDSASKTQLMEQMKSAAETNDILRYQLVRHSIIEVENDSLKGRLCQLEVDCVSN